MRGSAFPAGPREKSALRAAWQRIREHHLDAASNISEKSLLLVFTKADLFFIPRSRDDYKELIAGYTFPQRWRLTADELTGEFENTCSDIEVQKMACYVRVCELERESRKLV